MPQSRLIKPLLDQEYPMISHGKGIYLYDQNGKRYIDGSSGAVTASIGHGVDEIIEAMNEQAKKVAFVYRSQFTSEPAEQLADTLCRLSDGHLPWTFFVNSGTEATETAMKMAIQHWQEQGRGTKTKILSRWMSYHGITVGALSMSGHPLRRMRFVPLLEEYPSISPPYCYRCPHKSSYPSCQLACASELERVIKRIGAQYIAAFIAEPIVGAAGGALTPPDGYYEKIQEICEKHDVLFIMDEVMTGNGRTGTHFGYQHWNVKPDIVTLGKGLSAGYSPIAATLASQKVIDPILSGTKVVMSGHTFSGNPLSAAVSMAVLSYLERYKLVDQVEEKGKRLKQKLKRLQGETSMIGDIRGKGLLIGVELVQNTLTKQPFERHLNVMSRLVEKAQRNGLLIYPAAAGEDGIDGDAVILSPPFIISDDEMDELFNLFSLSIKELEHELKGEI
ncbi:aspartate aminotransferase family protein [Priestia koreensis]|uniref:aspartate aminotransferase family protein n=1 Tax=Priestia koreensis TaxID=284581 RepID=UPI00345A848D